MTVREQAPAALTDIALTVLKKRYLIKDDHGHVTETPETMFRRVADTIAAVDARYGATPDQVRLLFVDMLARANKLTREPEFYHTLTNNCTTNVVNHINKLWPNRIAYNVQLVLPGYSDRVAYALGLLDTSKSFEETRQAARVNRLAYVHRDSAQFSSAIREPMLALAAPGESKLR